MKRNNNVLEEDYVLISERNSESTDNTCQDVKKLSSTIELVILVNKGKEALVDGLTDHLSSWDKLSVKLVENVLEIISLNRFF